MLIYKNPKEDSNIKEVWYAKGFEHLYIIFRTKSVDRIYKYSNVSEYTYNKLINAKSKGEYFRKNILNNKDYEVKELFK